MKSLPDAAGYLKPGIDFAQLGRRARAMSDTECARKMSVANVELLRARKMESPAVPRIL